MNMKKTSLFIIMFAAALSVCGQKRTTKLAVYPEFRPSLIQLSDGRTIKQSLTNIFLKNSHLLYLQGDQVMEANMKNVLGVKFDDRYYVKIDSLLAYQVDSVGHDVLYCATIIDQEAYFAWQRNNQVITNLSLGELIQTTTIDLNTEEDLKFPLINLYYYRYNGQYVRCHERHMLRILPKEKKRILKTFVTMPDFSWTHEESLLKLLKGLQ